MPGWTSPVLIARSMRCAKSASRAEQRMSVGRGARPRDDGEKYYEEIRCGDFFGSTRGVGPKAGKPPEASAGKLGAVRLPFLGGPRRLFSNSQCEEART